MYHIVTSHKDLFLRRKNQVLFLSIIFLYVRNQSLVNMFKKLSCLSIILKFIGPFHVMLCRIILTLVYFNLRNISNRTSSPLHIYYWIICWIRFMQVLLNNVSLNLFTKNYVVNFIQ